jgi:hypothetical protein
MSEYDFILDNMKWSYSSANSYETCKGGFKLTYIDIEDRINNAFSDYGNLVHETLEKYFKDELKEDELLAYYEDNFDNFVENAFPVYPPGMRENYYKAGVGFFGNFKFDKELYDLIFIEDFINAEYHGIKLSVKPDLIIREKATGDCFLVDYKTAKMKSGKQYKDQIEEYKRQFLLYVRFLWTERDIEIKKLKIGLFAIRRKLLLMLIQWKYSKI